MRSRPRRGHPRASRRTGPCKWTGSPRCRAGRRRCRLRPWRTGAPAHLRGRARGRRWGGASARPTAHSTRPPTPWR
eukprot:14339565-Alexandrium_andersonii.AAC.1